jgi:murein DD-endopeptidase MepM/ murein hydrolase activator NlpD
MTWVRPVNCPSRERLMLRIILKSCVRRLSFLYAYNRRFRVAAVAVVLIIFLTSTALAAGWQSSLDTNAPFPDTAGDSAAASAVPALDQTSIAGSQTHSVAEFAAAETLSGDLAAELDRSNLDSDNLTQPSADLAVTRQNTDKTTAASTAIRSIPAATTRKATTTPATTARATTIQTTAATRTAAAAFPGIARSITDRWQFPLKCEPETPVYGSFGSARTSKRLHAGIDLYAPSGTAVYAMTSGKVQNIAVFYNNLMELAVANHDGTTIRYCELVPLVKIGDTVSQGQIIAKLRKNYDGTCMLHLEIYAKISSEPLTQTENLTHYLYVPIGKKPYVRRCDLVDPSAVYALRRP